ncbi:restriction endonuclease subunit S domain-containing protein [Pseudothauera lacus]|uniref:Uncharacterized protein n=1 Tax=Pseudothauera lacus TaxID=2136175 RepID=A0A2T4IIA6_9RHOO|nr:hypothetical protein [Pseudothauera lacus]PTD97498.1 hypothetical protein C8261_02100 [Pseudothauera lacus]
MNKKNLSERDICTRYVTPALSAAGWDVHTQVSEEAHLSEQHRILARGDELMALCDRLQIDLAAARAHLADTLVQAALEAA